jgi:hypothetical protein
MYQARKTIARGRVAMLLVCAAAISPITGCLSLGGRTTYMQSSPEVEARLKGLETRVGALEQAITVRQTTPARYDSGAEAIISQAPPAGEDTDDGDQTRPARR